jgi:hypothetical protein
VKPDGDDPETTTMELDELWSFASKKENNVWIKNVILDKSVSQANL